MDISALSAANFNASEWINSNYKKFLEEHNDEANTKPSSDADTSGGDLAVEFINSYVSKLQLYVQQVNYAVESTSQQIVASMPRITKEAKMLQSDVQELQKRMHDMRQEMADVQAETGECMASLERLNTLQCKLQAAKESLQESDGWGNLLAELEDCFERNDLKGVCEKLVALQKSLQAQEQLAGHAERQTQVEDFKNRLEALASPNVVQCFAEGNIEQAQKYVDIFVGIQRLPQLQQYYRAVQKNSLQQQWKQTLELHASDSTTTAAATQQNFLALFYDMLLEHLRAQVKWCAQVFNSSQGENLQPFLAIAELLPALQPTRDAHILQLLKTSNDRLELLQQYAQANQTFVLHLQAFVEQASLSLPQEFVQQLSDAIFEYYYKFIQQYPRLEETQLSTQVDRLFVTQNSASDAVHHLENSTQKLFEWLEAASQRCAAITSDLALCKMIALLGSIFKRLLENFAKTQRQLSLCIGGGNSVHSENWAHLQYTMSLLQCLADFQLKLHKFEKSLHERMTSVAEKLNALGKKVNICIYASLERGEQNRLLATIADYQQKRQDTSNSQLLCLGIFPQIYDALKAHFVDTHDITLGILLQPIEVQLQQIQPTSSDLPVDMDMPAFSYTPQECITQIGQYLLTLPQHLEPLLLAPSPLLKQALELCNIKYTQSIPCADILLSLVVEQCCVLYLTQLLQVKSLPPSHAKQMAVDIEYLSNVVEELGLQITTHLAQILTLLKASPDNYLAMSAGCEPRLVMAIRQMRNIISTQ